MKLTVAPLTPERWSDLEALFAGKGCSFARSCWCMEYRLSGKGPALAPGQTRAGVNRAALKGLVDGGRVPGLIGYRGRTPVGWVSLAPREEYARLKRSSVMKAVDEQPVWSVGSRYGLWFASWFRRNTGVRVLPKHFLKQRWCTRRRMVPEWLKRIPSISLAARTTVSCGLAQNRCTTRRDSRRLRAASLSARSFV